MKLSIHLVAWNGAKYIPHLFDSLRKQTFLDWQLLVIDNNSTDNTVELIKKELESFPVSCEIIENKENAGFAGGQNSAFKKTDTEYFLMLNQDMYLMPDCLEQMIKFLDSHLDVAAISPRLMKWDFDNIQFGLQKSFTDQVDSLGLKVYRNRRVVEQYAQASWTEVSNELLGQGQAFQVFGISGALSMFRRSAVKGVLYEDGTIFDESYGSYKEDVDLAYRLAASGNMACVLLSAAAFHDRSTSGPEQDTDTAALVNKQSQSEWAKYHSYKNHLMTLYKNEYWQNFILDFPWILWYELKKFVYFLLLDRQVLAGLKALFASNLVKKRKYIKQLRKIDWKQVRVWWR